MSACALHAECGYQSRRYGPPEKQKYQPYTRGMGATSIGAAILGLGGWPIIISTLIAGPVGLAVSGGITLAVIGVSTSLVYNFTEDAVPNQSAA